MFKIASLFIFVSIYFGQISLAQNKYYLKPTLEIKASSSGYFDYQVKPINNSGYYSFEKRKVVLPHGISPLLLGLRLGYHFNSKLSLELGIAQDEAVSGFNFYFKRGNEGSFSNNSGNESGGTSGRKISLMLNCNLINFDTTRKKINCTLDFLIGVSQYAQPKGPTHPLIRSGQDSVLIAPNTYMTYTVDTWSMNQWALLYTIGVSSDIRYKKRNICTVSLYYQYGRYHGRGSAILSAQLINILIEKPGEQIKYNEYVYSRASGFLFQISRKIYWSNFQKKDKEIQIRRFN